MPMNNNGCELSLQLIAFEATGQTEERDYFPLKARQVGGRMGSTSAPSQAGKECRAAPSPLKQM